MQSLRGNQPPQSRKLDNNDNDNLRFLVETVAVVFPFVAAYLVSLQWVWRRRLDQYLAYQREGKTVHGTLTFSGIKRRVTKGDGDSRTLFEAFYRYRVELDHNRKLIEIQKTSYFPKNSGPGHVKAVELLVLPGYPKSGLQCRHVQDQVDAISRLLSRSRWGIGVLVVGAVPGWIFLPKVANPDDWLTVRFLLILFSLMLLFLVVMSRLALKSQLYGMIDPTEEVSVSELSHDDGDPLLRPLTELRPLLAGPS